MKHFIICSFLIFGLYNTAHAQNPVPADQWQQNYALSDVKTAIANKVNALSGTSSSQTLNAPTLHGGVFDGSQMVTTAASQRSLASHLLDTINVRDYGARGDGVTDDGPAVAAAIAAAQPGGSIIFPYSSQGYVLNTGSFPLTQPAIYDLRGNHFSGQAIGTPETGNGLFNASFTNPWNITTASRRHYDPASYGPQKNNVTFQGEAVTCSPNHPIAGDQPAGRHWIACIYRGADTGSGGAQGTNISTEVDNDVLNLDSNSGVGYELDINVNGSIQDGGIQRGIFITGGGNAGNQWNGVGLDIQHGTYSGSGELNWSTGISVRNAHNAIDAYAEKDGAGFLYRGMNSQENDVYHVDTNGFISAAGLALYHSAVVTTEGIPAYTAQATQADDFVAQKKTASDSGFFWRSFDENGQQTSMIDKNGFATFAGLVSRNNITVQGKVCLDAICQHYIYAHGHTIHIGNAAQGDVASLDEQGNMTLKGRLVQNGTP